MTRGKDWQAGGGQLGAYLVSEALRLVIVAGRRLWGRGHVPMIRHVIGSLLDLSHITWRIRVAHQSPDHILLVDCGVPLDFLHMGLA
jgi:hypothetical protein